MTDSETVRAGRTDRWRGLAGAALLSAAVGLFTQSSGLVLVAGVGTVMLAYARVVTPPSATLSVERSFDPADPARDEPVTVELAVENLGERTLWDVRIADGVPDGLQVTDGEAALGTSLRPGAGTALSYEVAGSRRRYEFDPATVVLRDVTGVVERRVRLSADGTIGWRSAADERPAITPRQSHLSGLLDIDEGGPGVAFHTVREYQARDPLRRIDWRRKAKTGEFATVEYRRERSARVVLTVDTREAAGLAPASGQPTAIDRSVDAADTLLGELIDAGHRVGVAALSPPTLLPPGSSEYHRRRCHDFLARPPFGSGGTTARDTDVGADGGGSIDADRMISDLLARLPGAATVVLFTPLCDPASATAAKRVAAHGYDVTVVSPDPTATATTGQRLARLERRERLRQLRGHGIAVLDWEPGDSFVDALSTGWSR